LCRAEHLFCGLLRFLSATVGEAGFGGGRGIVPHSIGDDAIRFGLSNTTLPPLFPFLLLLLLLLLLLSLHPFRPRFYFVDSALT